MNIIDIIQNKKNGIALNDDQIKFFVKGAVDGSIADYQISALLMAICLKGMDENETYYLTRAMKNSGDVLAPFTNNIVADKHSTGGISDTVTLVITPILAECGVTVVKMSGRGLSHTGGTIDKLESIKGFNTSLSFDEIKAAVKKCNAVITSQTGNLVPADKILYALRDVTATVDSIPLIASSIMSKKLAFGADIIMLDVKYGSGAFMKNEKDALKLAKIMVNIGTKDGKKCEALVTSMQQPLTKYIGCNLELLSAVSVLKGEKNNDLYKVSKEICSRILVLADKAKDITEAYVMFDKTINSGKAIEKFKEIIRCQGGDDSVIDTKLKPSNFKKDIYIKGSGIVTAIDAEKTGRAVTKLGGGRERKGDTIDHSAGVILNIRINDTVKDGDILATMYTNDTNKFAQAEELLYSCYSLSNKKSKQSKLIYASLSQNETIIF